MRGDEGQLRQLFQNLIGNGDQVPRRTTRRASTCRAERDEASAWRFSVADNGIGIDPRHAERIFTVFKRLHTPRQVPGQRRRPVDLQADRRAPRGPHLGRAERARRQPLLLHDPRSPGARGRGRRLDGYSMARAATPLSTTNRAPRERPPLAPEVTRQWDSECYRRATCRSRPKRSRADAGARSRTPVTCRSTRTGSTARSRSCWSRTTRPTRGSPARCSRAAGCRPT